ncbi:MAG: leucine-rich repeat domain-containing protein [Candidatus Bruticola sp.]
MGFYKKNKGGTFMRRCRSYAKSINAVDSYLSPIKSLGGKVAGASEKENIQVPAESKISGSVSEPSNYKKSVDKNLKEKSVVEKDNLVSFISSFDFHKSEDGIVIARFVPSNKTRSLELPDSILGTQISAIGPGAFAGFTELAKVVIPEGVTSIGAGAFAGCSSLGSVTFPNTLKSIGAGAFKGCVSLKNIYLGSSLESLGESAFSKCTALKKVSLAVTRLTSIPKLCFFECESLCDIEWPSELNIIDEEAFGGCISLEVLRLPKSVQKLSCSSFRNCSHLTSVILPEGLTSLAELSFAECLSLEDIKLPENLMEIESSAFCGCTKIKRIRLNNKLQKIRASAFSGCLSLEEVHFPMGLLDIGLRAFSSCIKLKKIDLSRCQISSLGAEAFCGCQRLSELRLPLCLQKIGAFCFKNCTNLGFAKIPGKVISLGERCFEGCRKLVEIDLSASAVSIPEGCFAGCFQLTRLRFNKDTAEIGVCAFAECRDLSCIVLPDNVQVIRERAFLNCVSLTEVNCGSQLRRLGSEAFKGCSNLRRVDLPASLNSLGAEGEIFSNTADELVIYGTLNSSAEEYARRCRIKFYDPLLHEMKDEGNEEEPEDSGLASEDNSEELTPEEAEVEEIESSSNQPVSRQLFGLKVTPSSYKSITSKGDWIVIRHKAFEKKADARSNVPIAVHLENINHIGNRAFCNRNVVYLDCSDSLVSIGKSAFWGCSLMQKVRWSKRLSFIDKSAFWGCHSLKSLEFPDSLQFIDNWAFLGCSGIENLRLPAYLVSLGDYVFAYCTSLVSVVIPSGTRSLGVGVFFGCDSLRRVIIPPSVKQFGPELCKFSPIFGRGCSLECGIDVNNEYGWEVPEQITIVCQKDSAAHEYALQFGIKFELADFKEEMSSNGANPGGSYMLGGLGVSDGTFRCAQAFNGRLSFASFRHSVRVVTPAIKDRTKLKRSLLNEQELAGMSPAEVFSILQGAYEILDLSEFGRIWQKPTWRSGSSFKKVLNSSRLFSSIKDILPKELEPVSKEKQAEEEEALKPNCQDILNAACDILDLMEGLGYFQFPASAAVKYRLQGNVSSVLTVEETDLEPTLSVESVEEQNDHETSEILLAPVSSATQDSSPQEPEPRYQQPEEKVDKPKDSSAPGQSTESVKAESIKALVQDYESDFNDASPSHLLGNMQRLSQNREKLAGFFSGLAAGLSSFSNSPIVMPKSRRELDRRYFNAFHLQMAEAADCVKTSSSSSASSTAEVPSVEKEEAPAVQSVEAVESNEVKTPTADSTDASVADDIPEQDLEELDCADKTEHGAESVAQSDSVVEKTADLPASCEEATAIVSSEGVVLARIPNFTLVRAEVPNELEGRPVESLGDNFIKGSNTVEEIFLGSNLRVIGSDAFRSCSRLRLISMSERLQIIKDGAMRSCERLVEISVPDSVEEIGSRVFCACSGLRSVKLSSGLIRIGEAAFADCRSLESLELPSGLKKLGSKAFFGCRSLKSIFIPESLETLEDKLFDVSQKLTIYAPANSAAAAYASIHNIPYCEASSSNWHSLAAARQQTEVAVSSDSATNSVSAEVKFDTAEDILAAEKKAKYLKRLASRIKGKRR